MAQRPGVMVAFAVLLVALAYLGLCGALFLGQGALLYFPQPPSGEADGELLALPMAGGPPGSRVLASVRRRHGPKALLYFGGNAEAVAGQLPLLEAAFPDHALYLMHYRGYGGSSGQPSEQALFADALALFDRVRTDHDHIAVLGRSLGSGVAVHLAAHRPVAGLVLVTPFDSIEAVASQQFPLVPMALLLRDKYRSWADAPRVNAPTLLIAAERDEVIPRANTDALLSHFRPGLASLVVLPVDGHNAVEGSPSYIPLLREFSASRSAL
ncbi:MULTISPECIES: alpha/beta fold hydrolase [unclassified Cyanobium]|uniref:alpha/beta hydrolase n=1 Tax=unclassified Cyanobium TaxID=2627006 RepID=UPI0020CF62C8|nr:MULTISPECIES: alpha/beta fold hydrolase [unclassified Cyanobium]